MNTADRCRLFLAKLPKSITGQGGHAALFRAACACVEFGLSADDARQLLAEWNVTHCEPQWSEADIEHKLRSAFAKTGPQPNFVNGGGLCPRRGTVSHPDRCAERVPAIVSPARPAACNSRGLMSPTSIPSECRAVDWRAFCFVLGSPGQIAVLASMRHVSREAVTLAERRGQLRFGQYRRCPAWFVTDPSRRLAVVRRMDGERWETNSGQVKALTLKDGPRANGDGVWPVGVLESRNYPCVVIVEGGPDLLAAYEFIVRERRQDTCAVVMMYSSSPAIHADALQHFKGKRVRIFTHDDESGAGDKAAERWRVQLESVGATVDCYRCGTAGCKDLNDLTRKHDFNETILP